MAVAMKRSENLMLVLFVSVKREQFPSFAFFISIKPLEVTNTPKKSIVVLDNMLAGVHSFDACAMHS